MKRPAQSLAARVRKLNHHGFPIRAIAAQVKEPVQMVCEILGKPVPPEFLANPLEREEVLRFVKDRRAEAVGWRALAERLLIAFNILIHPTTLKRRAKEKGISTGVNARPKKPLPLDDARVRPIVETGRAVGKCWKDIADDIQALGIHATPDNVRRHAQQRDFETDPPNNAKAAPPKRRQVPRASLPKRKCLSCGKMFASSGPGERICGKCKSSEAFQGLAQAWA